ncbi:MAG: DUF885 family protein, partial [Candidatus Obscuribacterales bacterium]|nr:DUF885 family protein [Steroidobacteraceae bacterium]
MKILSPAIFITSYLLTSTTYGADDSVTRLHALYDVTRERHLREDPRRASEDGDKRYNALWPDWTLASIQAIAKADAAALDALDKISVTGLDEIEQVNRAIFRRMLQNELDRFRFAEHERPLDQLNYSGGALTLNEIAGVISFDSVRDYQDWIARIRGVDALVEQTIALLREGIKHKNVQPKHIILRVREQLKAQVVDNPDQSPFFEPFKEFPPSIGPAERGQLIGVARVAIRETTVPAFRKLDAFLA